MENRCCGDGTLWFCLENCMLPGWMEILMWELESLCQRLWLVNGVAWQSDGAVFVLQACWTACDWFGVFWCTCCLFWVCLLLCLDTLSVVRFWFSVADVCWYFLFFVLESMFFGTTVLHGVLLCQIFFICNFIFSKVFAAHNPMYHWW